MWRRRCSVTRSRVAATRSSWPAKCASRWAKRPTSKDSRAQAILRAIDESLRRLQTDYLDLYYLHAPDHTVPVEESLEAMESLVKQGKVRYFASSNYAGWEVVQMLWICEERGWHAPYVSQPMYNLLARGIEQEYLRHVQASSASRPWFTTRWREGCSPASIGRTSSLPGTRFDNNKLYQDRYWHTQYFNAVERLRQIAQSAGRSLVSLALNWLLHHTMSDVIILGASSLAQLNENLAAAKKARYPKMSSRPAIRSGTICAVRCQSTTASRARLGRYWVEHRFSEAT